MLLGYLSYFMGKTHFLLFLLLLRGNYKRYMDIEWNKVTWYSKALALILAAAILYLGYLFGAAFGQLNNNIGPVIQPRGALKGSAQISELVPLNKNADTVQNKTTEPDLLSALDLIVGKWQRVELLNQIVEYKLNGSAEVFLNGGKTSSFSWDIIHQNGFLVVAESGTRYYKVLYLDTKTLKLLYLYNGQILNYNRIK
jgi:hypothetical protein